MNRNALLIAILATCAMATAGAAAEVTVIDGDTIVYDGRQAEIWGTIAPSRTEICTTSTNEKWPCGERAYEQLSELARDETFRCEEKEERFLLCRAGGLDVGLLMVKEGLVRARQDYHDVEARAREAKVGLWQ
ncbi:thermonuclease family protein [Mesorhizobium sp. VNQ89]|uniref:thermonuclease family protein n=1 Tax=Mesorhizobium quangtriensis TaxID=3157709 RepID=UPI0032B7D998